MPRKKKEIKRRKMPWATIIVGVAFILFLSYFMGSDRDTTSLLEPTTTTTVPDEPVDDVTDIEPPEDTYYPPHPNVGLLPKLGYTLYGSWGDEATAKSVARIYDDHVVYHNNGWWFVWAKPNPTVPVVYNDDYESDASQALSFGMGVTIEVVRV